MKYTRLSIRRIKPIFFTVLTVICLFSWQYVRQLASAQQKIIDNTLNLEDPLEEYMLQISLVRFDSQGKVTEQLDADYWEKFRHHKITTFHSPRFTAFDNQHNHYLITAKYATTHHINNNKNIDHITLTDEVYIIREGWQLLTNKLIYHPKSQVAETNSPITILGPNSKVLAKGLLAELAQGKIQLLKEVTSYYY